MRQSLLQKLNLGIEHLLSYPGCDKKTLSANKTLWLGNAYGLFHVFVLTFSFLLFAPQLTLLIRYGYFLLILFPSTLFLLIWVPRYFQIINYVHGLVFNLVTFFYILRLGGIATSGGLIFVGITIVMASIPMQKVWISVSHFIIYVLTVILMVALKPWLTVPAQMTPALNSIVYMLNTLSMSGLSLYLVISFLAQRRKLEELESNKLRELNEAKNKLFTNITHEFRTPLTVIQGMADLIEKNPEEWQKEGPAKIKKNSNILLNLVNQMLDLAKIESGVMQTHIAQSDIIAYIGYVTDLFKSAADSLNIVLSYKSSGNQFVMDFDPGNLHHILSNLLSNALKFTQEGGTVMVSTFNNEVRQLLTISVTDTGIGISEEHLPHIFDRFYQVENSTINPNGSGLGLALAKELTELLGGNITVESKPGEGTSFSVELPVRHNAHSESHSFIELSKDKISALSLIDDKTHPVTKQKIHAGEVLPLLLIIEDSHDVTRYLEAILKNEYQVEHAENGKRGLEKAMRLIPDIILSDVMMPEMDGISLLETIKNDIRTSHIPMVMLTAKADVSSRLSGLERGADAYLAKPFEEKELHIILKNLVEIRKKLHKRYSSPENFPLLPDPGFRMEDEFMGRVKQVLEENLENDEFGITQLCSEIAVSRTQLYRKFKSVSNKTIAEYFKSLRLLKAKTLLSSTTMNVTEVVFATGFKNLSYFSREFSAEFGSSPNDFRRKIHLERSAKK